jgi:large subunit ribosomal protein L2
MGKRLITQRRGKGSSVYRAHSFKFPGRAKHPTLDDSARAGAETATVVDFIRSAAHSTPLAQVEYTDGERVLMLACEGMKVGDTITSGLTAPIQPGSTLALSAIPEGTLIYNIESMPGDGGKFVRASGTFARIITKTPNGVLVRLPSKKQKVFHEKCRASIGILAGGGRTDKPILKAGIAFYFHRKKNRMYPIVAASAMNAVNHPYGNKRTSRKSKKRPVARNTPPGRKVGMIAARRTGRRKK